MQRQLPGAAAVHQPGFDDFFVDPAQRAVEDGNPAAGEGEETHEDQEADQGSYC